MTENQEAVCRILILPHFCHLPDKYFRDISRDIYLKDHYVFIAWFQRNP